MSTLTYSRGVGNRRGLMGGSANNVGTIVQLLSVLFFQFLWGFGEQHKCTTPTPFPIHYTYPPSITAFPSSTKPFAASGALVAASPAAPSTSRDPQNASLTATAPPPSRRRARFTPPPPPGLPSTAAVSLIADRGC